MIRRPRPGAATCTVQFHAVISDAIQTLIAGTDLTRDQAAAAMDELMSGEATAAQIGGFLVALRMKGETVGELIGLVSSMREHAVTFDAPAGAIDTCGTGGDGSGTFNISSAAALVARGAGAIVAKHGNRAQSSKCGSADVLEALGVNVTLQPDAAERCLKDVGIAFLFAPNFHPAMKHVAGARKELGVRTVFNILGPLANPGRVRRQALGAAGVDVAARMVQVLAGLGCERALVFHGADGLDELTTTGPSHIFDLQAGAIQEYDFDPATLGFPTAAGSDLVGGDAARNAAIILEVLQGAAGPHRDVVLLNTAAALVVAGRAEDMAAGVEVARQAIDSGAASRSLQQLVDTSQALAGSALANPVP
jgi:anthranilate phosphoribosyltransferase